MASGKQLAFNYGEVSPAYRYKSSTVAYTQGLHKLRNGFPRQGGGVSNRAGFRFIRPLVDADIQPQGIQSNTKLFYEKRKEYLTDRDTSKKHTGTMYFVYPQDAGMTVGSHVWFSDFSQEPRAFVIQEISSTRIPQSNLIGFEDDIYFTLRDSGIVRFPYEEIFDPREGVTGIPKTQTAIGLRHTRIDVEVVADYFYRNSDGVVVPPALEVQMASEQTVNTQAFYIITETKQGELEKAVCGYLGSFNAFQGQKVVFTLVDSLFLTFNNMNTFWRANRRDGVLLLKAGATTSFSIRPDGTGGPDTQEGSVLSVLDTGTPIRLDAIKTGVRARPSSGRYIYNLYRSFSIGDPAVLVNTKVVDYEILNRLSNREALVSIEDLSSSAGVASRPFRDSFRLYGGLKDDRVDNRYIDFKQVDYGFHNPVNKEFGIHRFFRPTQVNINALGNTEDVRFVPFVRVRELMRYQQRTFASYIDRGPSDAENTLRSVIGVSKINSKHDFATAPVVNPANAFEFNIPLGDVSEVVAMLGADRPLIFTLNNVYMLLGTDSGIVTPTEINPTVVYTGGCSETVRPVLVDNQAFFLSNDHTSLVMIAFNASGGRGVQVIETDEKAKHFLEMNIVQIAVVKSFETIIWLLTSEGKLVSMTMYGGGQSFGFALHELSDGHIENITAARYPYIYHGTAKDNAWTTPDVEVLAATIIRDGQRSLEVMTGRDDRLSENMGFMDGFKTFGTRLTARQDGYNFDLERPRERFESIYLTSGDAEREADLDAIFNSFGEFIKTQDNWPRFIFDRQIILAGEGEVNRQFQYFPNPETVMNPDTTSLNRRPFARIGLTTGEEEKVYDSEEYNQRIDINGTHSRYTVAFSRRLSALSFMPARLAASKGVPTSAGDAVYPFFLLMYFEILRRYLLDSRYIGLHNRQKAIVLEIIRNGYTINVSLPEYIRYYTGDKDILLRREGRDYQAPSSYLDLSSLYAGIRIGSGSGNLGKAGNFLTGTSASTTLIDYATVAPGVVAGVPTPQFVPSTGTGFSSISASYAPVGNEDIPGKFLRVIESTTISDQNKFRFSTNWSPLTNKVTGLEHLNGKKVAVFADNEVVSNPISDDETVANQALTVENGELTLPNYYQYGMVGLPYKFEMETLQIETQDERALITGRKVVNKLNVALHRTREGLMSSAIKGFEYDPEVDKSFPVFNEGVRQASIDPKNGTFSGVVEPDLASGWSEGGRVRLTNSDPTPVTVNAIYPRGIESGD